MTESHPPVLRVSVTSIRREPGSRLPVDQRLRAEKLGLSDVSVPDGSDVRFVGELESIASGVVLTGSAEVPWEGTCRRCLSQTTGLSAIDIREVYEVDPTEGETWPLEGDEIDLGPLLHDIALLALPLAPLCGEDCKGPAPEQFPTTVASEPEVDEDGAEQVPKDPRWAALDDLEL